jgi:predicted transcriptional regulator
MAATRIIKIQVDKESYVKHYLTVMNCCFNLADRELAVLSAMVNNSEKIEGNLVCYSRNIKDVRTEIDVTNGYVSSMMSRIKEKGAIDYNRDLKGWIISDLMNPFANSNTVNELTFQFEGNAI